VRVVMFYHSLVSDWNHGNAHFLRGIVTDLQARGHEVTVHEPRDGWSLGNLVAEYGEAPLDGFARAYPGLRSHRYGPRGPALDAALEDADLVLVHEWSEPELVRRIGEHRRAHDHYRLLFHDTHHRAATDPAGMARYDLSHFDGVLAYGRVIRDLYVERGWAREVWVWHEAADTRVFRPVAGEPRTGDLVWIGNWGDDERTAELQEYLLDPVRDLGLRARVHGVRYPADALRRLAEAGIQYAGWLPNYEAPRVYARFGVTVHVQRRPYVEALPGIPTIRVFEALACGIPLVSAPWDDAEGLFRPGEDFLVARGGAEMRRQLRAVLHEPELARTVADSGRRRVLERHTCTHRVDELLTIAAGLGCDVRPRPTAAAPSGAATAAGHHLP